MLISYAWLRRYVATDAPPAVVADRLTMLGFPVVAVEHLASGDVRLDVEVTSNRPDLQSHVGVAREVAAALDAPLTLPTAELPELSADTIEVGTTAPDLCPWYTARVVRGVRVGPSPAWLRELLEAAGQRSVNNVVDVTNFVLLEYGHPLHAFDLARLRGPRLAAARADGASFATLGGARVTLAADDCAIVDAAGPVALGGVMGGADSEVSEATQDVVLECALFAPLAIRAASRRHQLRTDSSFRFERFVDPACAQTASDRAAALLVEVCGATSVGPVCSAGPGVGAHADEIEFRPARVGRLLGIDVPAPESERILASLGLVQLAATGRDVSRWRAPTWRPDLREEIDLVEEVARRVGFEQVPDEVRIAVRPLPVDAGRRAIARLRDACVRAGLRECCTAPFVGEGAADIALLTGERALRVENPMRSEEALLRRSVLGPLLLVARGNQDRGVPAVRLFEMAPVYVRGEADDAARELHLLGAVLHGTYADAYAVALRVLEAVGLRHEIRVEVGAPEVLRADRCATLLLDGVPIGHVGELAPRALRELGLAAGVAVLEVRADVLAARARLDVPYRPVSRYPAVERDLAVVVADHVQWAEIVATVHDAAGELLANVRPFDVYRGPQVGPGRKSVALRMELRSHERTLTGEAADACVRGVVEALGDRHGAELRA